MSVGDFWLLLLFIGMGWLVLMLVIVPAVEDMLVSDNATWEFHNSIVQDKYIKEEKGSPFGNTKYYVKIDNYTIEASRTIWYDIIPNNTWLGYYVNNETGETTISR